VYIVRYIRPYTGECSELFHGRDCVAARILALSRPCWRQASDHAKPATKGCSMMVTDRAVSALHRRPGVVAKREPSHLPGVVDPAASTALASTTPADGSPRGLALTADRIDFPRVFSQSASMQAVGAIIDDIADTDATTLILGESGVGKDIVARAIH